MWSATVGEKEPSWLSFAQPAKGFESADIQNCWSSTLFNAFYERWQPKAPKFCRNLICTSVPKHPTCFILQNPAKTVGNRYSLSPGVQMWTQRSREAGPQAQGQARQSCWGWSMGRLTRREPLQVPATAKRESYFSAFLWSLPVGLARSHTLLRSV